MLINTKEIFTYSIPAKSGRPYINAPITGYSFYTSSALIASKRTIMDFVKRSPEALGIIRAIAMDIVTKLDFKSIALQGKGRPFKELHQNKEDESKEFAKRHQVKQTLMAEVMDMLITGELFNWIGDDFTEKVKEITERVTAKTIKEKFPDVKEEEIKEILKSIDEEESSLILEKKKFIDEDPEGMKQFVQVPSTTMSIRINIDGTGVEMFRQDTYTKVREWKPSTIIHGKFMDLDGKINGYTPMEANIPLIKTLGLITDYHGQFFDSGGTPDLIFIFKQMGGNEPALAKWQQVIDEWGQTKRRGHLVIGGEDFALERANEMNKDMEFRKLAIFYVGRMAFSFGMPLEKFQAILGSEVKSSTGSSELGNADYMRNISDMQDYLENLFNTQFWNPFFSVDMKFSRGFLQDKVRQYQVDTQKVAVIKGMVGIIKKDKFPEYVNMHFPEIPRDWINEEIDVSSMNPSNEQQLPDDKVQKGEGRQAYAEQKKKQQGPQQRNNKPSGS